MAKKYTIPHGRFDIAVSKNFFRRQSRRRAQKNLQNRRDARGRISRHGSHWEADRDQRQADVPRTMRTRRRLGKALSF
jgi:hypothetical protein